MEGAIEGNHYSQTDSQGPLAWRHPDRRGAPGFQHTSQATSDSAEVGTNVIYATTMHFGAKKGEFGEKTFVQHIKGHIRKAKSGKTSTVKAHDRTVTLKLPWNDIPARPVFVIQPEDIVDVTDLINGYLAQ